VAPAGYAKDTTPQTAVVDAAHLIVTKTFTNQLGEIIIYKKDIHGVIITLSGFTVTVFPNPYGGGTLTVHDNGLGDLNDKNMTYGTIRLINVPLGSYTITETAAPTGYIVDPTPHPVDVTSSTTPVEVTSTDQKYGHLEIFKYNDLNGINGLDPGEPGLNGWVFTITDIDGNPVGGTYTTHNGGWIHADDVGDLIPGDYLVTETQKDNWLNTDPGPGPFPPPLRPPYSKWFTVPDGVTAQDNFGNIYTKKTLWILKFNDLNGNGVQDPGERPLGGWEFTIDGIGKRTTGSDGWIEVDISGAGYYIVTEELKSGWQTSTPNPQTADLQTKDIDYLYFGNVQQLQHPPLVPIIGTWGTALMAAAFAGSLIWVVALRRRRRTI
jgi:hypothetical protein